MPEEKSDLAYYRVTPKGAVRVQGSVIGESRWILYVNDHEFVTFMATPRNLHHLALGFLISERVISGLSDVASLRVNLAADCAYWYIPALGVEETRSMAVCEEGVGSIQVRLTSKRVTLPARRVITSGCGGGTTFDDMKGEQPPLTSRKQVTATSVLALMQELNQKATLYRESRGVHTSALADEAHLIVIAEDVGRHNTLDKLRGECLLRGIETRDMILLSTGRISSEMMTKASRMGTPIVVSRTSPTHLAVQLAQAWNITLVGYAWAGQMQVYHGLDRIVVG